MAGPPVLNLRRKWVNFYSAAVRAYNDVGAELATHQLALSPDSPPMYGRAIRTALGELLPDLDANQTVLLRGADGDLLVIRATDKLTFKKLQSHLGEATTNGGDGGTFRLENVQIMRNKKAMLEQIPT